MLHLQNLKHASILQGSYTNGATATGTVDTLGFDSVLISVTVATSDSTSNNPSVFKLEEGDTTSSFSTLSAVGDTDWTIPIADTSNATIFQFHVNKSNGNRKRYLKLSISPTTTQIISATAMLGRAKQLPDTTTDQGTVYSLNL